MLHSRKSKIILSCLLLVVVVSIGTSWAWNVHRVELVNDLQSRTVSSHIEEVFDEGATPSGTVGKEVTFVNDGTAAVFLRMTYVEYWETAEELLEGYTDDETVHKAWTAFFQENWVAGGDGWYYYNQVLPAGATTEAVLESVKFGAGIPEDASYTLMFQMETLQVSDQTAVNQDATTSHFGIAGTLVNPLLQEGAVVGGQVAWDIAQPADDPAPQMEGDTSLVDEGMMAL